MMETKAFECFPIPDRAAKPRARGITILEDAYFSTLGLEGTRDLMQYCGEYIDFAKIAASMVRYQSRDLVRQKVALYREHGAEVFLGGAFFELAVARGVARAFLEESRDLGLMALEVSDTAIPFTVEQKVDIIRWVARQGFKVIAEAGKKKMANATLSAPETIRMVQKFLGAGAYKVILESDEIEKALEGEAAGAANLIQVISTVGPENVVLETPLGVSHNVAREFFNWAIMNFGAEVNIGNVLPEHILLLEMMRRGTFWRTYGRVVDTSEFALDNAQGSTPL